VTGDFRAARSHVEEGLAVARAVGDKAILAYLLVLLGQVAFDQGEDSRAWTLLEEGIMLHRVAGNTHGILYALFSLKRMHFAQGEVARARALNEEYLVLSKAMGFRPAMADALSFQGCLALQEGNVEMAGERFEEGLALLREGNDSWFIAICLQEIGVLSRAGHEECQSSTSTVVFPIRDTRPDRAGGGGVAPGRTRADRCPGC
jgi:hypothetical protein